MHILNENLISLWRIYEKEIDFHNTRFCSDSSKDNDANSKIDTTETGSNTTKSDTSSAPVSVTLNEVAHSIFYAPMYVAIENGYFKDEGIELTLVTGFGADKTMTAVISGEADIGFMGSEA